MPLLEAFPDENQILKYKLVTLPKNTSKMPILQLGVSAITFQTGATQQSINPATINASDGTLGYTFILYNSDVAKMIPGSDTVSQTGATIPTFISDEDLKNSTTVVAKSVTLTSRQLATTTTTQLTIVGNQTGATTTISVTTNSTLSTQ